MHPIRRELERFAVNLPLPARRDFARYLHQARGENHQRTALRAGKRDPAYWLLLPWWVWKAKPRRPSRGTLNDIVWAQYCLYLGVRIKDDLFDGQARHRNLHLACNAFLAEGERAFLAYFPPSSLFWSFYRRCMRSTQAAILRVDKIQRAAGAKPSDLLSEYPKVSALFKIGMFASCLLTQKRSWIPSLSRFADEMAIAGQILDDFQDISEDFVSGRLNYAALYCMKRDTTKHRNRSQLSATMAGRILFTDAADGIFTTVREHLDRAADALRVLPLRDGGLYLNRYCARLDRFKTNLHHRRSQYTFSSTFLS